MRTPATTAVAAAKPASAALVPGYVPPLAMFLARRVIGRAGARLDWQDVYAALAADGSTMPAPHFGKAMAWLCRAKGVRVEIDGARVYCVGCELLSENSPRHISRDG